MRNLRRRQAIAPDDQQIDKDDLAKALADPENALVVSLQLHLKKPLSLPQLVRQTHFSQREVRAIYRLFKEASTNAIIHRDIVRTMFSQLFPRGDTVHFADMIFNQFDSDQSGAITFDKYLKALSVLSRGSLEEKLDWLYKMYDPLGSGHIGWHRLLYVLTATEDLAEATGTQQQQRRQTQQQPGPGEQWRRERHVQALFRKFDPFRSGTITREAFLEVCRADPAIQNSLQNLDCPF